MNPPPESADISFVPPTPSTTSNPAGPRSRRARRPGRLDGRDLRALLLRAGLLAGLVVAATYLPAALTGGATSLTHQVMGGLLFVVFMWLVRARRVEQARARQRLDWSAGEFRAQHQFLAELAPLEHLQSCLEHVVQAAAKQLACQRSFLLMPDEAAQCLRVEAFRGLHADDARRARLPLSDTLASTLYRSHEPLAADGPDLLPGWADLSPDVHELFAGPVLIAPLRWGHNVLGALAACNPLDGERFCPDRQAAFASIAQAASVAIQNHLTQLNLKQTQVGFLNTLANLIETRDPHTRGHSQRVCEHSLAIGRLLGLGEAALANLEAAARLHDIGKVAVPDTILSKPGALTDWEYAAVQKHARAGAQILASSFLAPAAVQAIRYHHERLDGTGYPEALSGPEIPLAARIISVADTFDALTNSRPHRQALSLDAALDIICRQAGTTLDAQCVSALLRSLQPASAPA